MTTKALSTAEREQYQAQGLDLDASGLLLARRHRMARYLEISERQLDRLTAQDVLKKNVDGLYPVRPTIDAYLARRTSAQTGPRAALMERQEQLLALRLDRERKDLISMEETLATFDHIIERFFLAIVEVGNRVGTPDAIAQCAKAVAELRIKFAARRTVLISGRETADE